MPLTRQTGRVFGRDFGEEMALLLNAAAISVLTSSYYWRSVTRALKELPLRFAAYIWISQWVSCFSGIVNTMNWYRRLLLSSTGRGKWRGEFAMQRWLWSESILFVIGRWGIHCCKFKFSCVPIFWLFFFFRMLFVVLLSIKLTLCPVKFCHLKVAKFLLLMLFNFDAHK